MLMLVTNHEIELNLQPLIFLQSYVTREGQHQAPIPATQDAVCISL